MYDMMRYAMYGSSQGIFANIAALIIAIIVGLLIYLGLGEKKEEHKKKHTSSIHSVKRFLSEDELAALKEIKKKDGITQASLRLRLNWSKAKVSSILSHLDRMKLIRRERDRKTYKIYSERRF